MIWRGMAVLAEFFDALGTEMSEKILNHRSSRQFNLVFRTLACLILLPFTLLFGFFFSYYFVKRKIRLEIESARCRNYL